MTKQARGRKPTLIIGTSLSRTATQSGLLFIGETSANRILHHYCYAGHSAPARAKNRPDSLQLGRNSVKPSNLRHNERPTTTRDQNGNSPCLNVNIFLTLACLVYSLLVSTQVAHGQQQEIRPNLPTVIVRGFLVSSFIYKLLYALVS